MTTETTELVKNTKTFSHRNKFLFYDAENVLYTFGINQDKTIQIKNFLHRFAFLEDIKKDLSSWSYWTIRDKETPEILSYKLYNTSHLYWLICVFNNIMCIERDWPKNDKLVYEYSIEKYGAANINSIHHIEAELDANEFSYPPGTIVDSSYSYNTTNISNLQYEIVINDNKRNIKLIHPQYIPAILNQFHQLNYNRNL